MPPIHVHPSGVAATEAERDALFALYCRAAAVRAERLTRLRRNAGRLGTKITLARGR